MKNDTEKINFIRLFSLFFKTLENLNHDLTLRTLSSVYIYGLKGGMYTPHEILTSTYGMELKLELVLVFDGSRQ